ncbi:MAG: hypothetical protein AAFO06_25555 [Cyanobacteria bacterium J06597_16]
MHHWKRLTLSGLGILISSALFPSFEPISTAKQSALRPTSDQKPQIVSYVLKDLESIETQAMSRTAALRSHPWNAAEFDGDKFDREWRNVGALWQEAAAEAVKFSPTDAEPTQRNNTLTLNQIGTLVSTKLQPLHYEYLNRQDLTAAMHAYHKSILLAEQPDAGSAEQCDIDATFADSPEQWAEIVALRKDSVQYLEAVSQHVSFYPDQVVPLKSHYEEKLRLASRFYHHSPWYYAIQKAVCATQWAEQAKQNEEKASWAKSAALWEKGVELLENAPESIPYQVPSKIRDDYKAAQNNLELWKKNLKDAEARAKAQR